MREESGALSNLERSELSTLNPSLVPKPGYYLRGIILVLLRPFITICQWHISFPLPTSPFQVPLSGSHEKPPEIGILNRSKSSLSAEESPADRRRIFHGRYGVGKGRVKDWLYRRLLFHA